MAARDDAGARKAQHEKEVRDLQTQVSFLEEEISVLRRKLAESPRQVRVLEERLHEAQASLAAVTGQNERLVATLKEAREQIIALKEEVDRLAQPPSAFGTFLAAREDGRSIEVIDLRSLSPIDVATITASVARTGRCVVAHEAPVYLGLGAEIAARVF